MYEVGSTTSTKTIILHKLILTQRNPFFSNETGDCNYDNLVDEMDHKVEEDDRCINSGAEEVQLLVGELVILFVVMIEIIPN